MGVKTGTWKRGMRMIEHSVVMNGIDVLAVYSERAVKEIFLPLLK